MTKSVSIIPLKFKSILLARPKGERHKLSMVLHSQTAHVSVAHRYWNTHWSEAKNREIYGRLASENGVGSNFVLTLTLPLSVDPKPPLKKLKELIDHKCLYLDQDEFRDSPSTAEAIAQFLAKQIECPWHSLRLMENKHWSVVVEKEPATLWVEEQAFNVTSRRRMVIDPESGMAGPRGELEQAMRQVAVQFAESRAGELPEDWAKRLAAALEPKVSGLVELVIDIGGQRFLRVQM